MFTGIVEAVGTVSALVRLDVDARVRVTAPAFGLQDVKPGDSIAVSGVCLTVVALTDDSLEFDVSGETSACTTWRYRRPGDKVNLEKALALGARLGGHLVSGHVDGVARVLERKAEGRSTVLLLEAPAALRRYIADKGSVCVDGVSLTVNRTESERFTVNLVPHTLTATTLGDLTAGDAVNLEVDILARYLERLLKGERGPTE